MTAKKADVVEIDSTCRFPNCMCDNDKAGGTYTLAGGCYNCGLTNIVGTFSKGHKAVDRSEKCPNCGCKDVYWKRP